MTVYISFPSAKMRKNIRLAKKLARKRHKDAPSRHDLLFALCLGIDNIDYGKAHDCF